MGPHIKDLGGSKYICTASVRFERLLVVARTYKGYFLFHSRIQSQSSGYGVQKGVQESTSDNLELNTGIEGWVNQPWVKYGETRSKTYQIADPVTVFKDICIYLFIFPFIG